MIESTVVGHGRLIAKGQPRIDSFCGLTWPHLIKTGGAFGSQCHFTNSGDNNHAGDGMPESRGLVHKLGTGLSPDYWSGVGIDGDGPVEIHFRDSFIWVGACHPFSARWSIFQNAVEIAYVARTYNANTTDSANVDITGVSVSRGDTIEAHLLCLDCLGNPPNLFFSSPAGFGGGTNQLTVSGFLTPGLGVASAIRLHGTLAANL